MHRQLLIISQRISTEEVELDEAKYTGKLMKNKSIVDYVKKQQEKNRKDKVWK
jgi:hypothetical protein